MSYEIALNKAWLDLRQLAKEKTYTVKFLGDEYSVDLTKHSVLSLACNVSAKGHAIILVLHYLIQKLKMGLPQISDEWISFQQLEGGQDYFPTFKKRVIERILRKYGKGPEGILDSIDRFSAKRVQFGDVGIVIEVFEGVPVMLSINKADEEFGADANVLFDRSITKIFATEDIIIICDCIAASI